MANIGLARICALGIVLLIPSVGMAQVWVSRDSVVTTPCGDKPANACNNLQQAINEVAPGGLVHVLPGNYGGVVIQKSVELLADSGGANIDYELVPITCQGQNTAVCIAPAAPDVIVRIRGFTIIESIPSDNVAGIYFHSGTALHLENSTIINMRNTYGIHFKPVTTAELYMSNSVISDNRNGVGGGGILIKPTGSSKVTAVLENLKIENNRTGIQIDGASTSSPGIKVDLVDSVVSGNTAQGVFADSPSNGASVDVTIKNSTITGNGHAGILAQAASPSGRGSVIVRFGGSTISNNGAGVLPYSSGVVRSLGGNFVDANGSGNGPFTITNPE